MSVQNSDWFVANVTVYFMSKQNKVRSFSAYAEFEFLNNCFVDGKCWNCTFWQRDCLAIIFVWKWNERDWCLWKWWESRLQFRANFWFLSFDLAICLVTLIWSDWSNKWSLICLICFQFIDQMIIRSIEIYRLTIFSVLYFWVVDAVNKCFLLRKVHVELALVLC